MVRRSERCLGSRMKKVRKNEDNPIIVDDSEVYLRLIDIICYFIDKCKYILSILYSSISQDEKGSCSKQTYEENQMEFKPLQKVYL